MSFAKSQMISNKNAIVASKFLCKNLTNFDISKILRQNSTATTAGATSCPHFTNRNDNCTSTPSSASSSSSSIHNTIEWQNALPYEEVPGPKPIPILGNTWR